MSPKGRLKEAGHRITRQAHSNQKQNTGQRNEQRSKAGENDGKNGKAVDERREEMAEESRMTGRGGHGGLRNPQQSQRNDERHGAEVEEPLDDVDGDLRTQRFPGLFGDQVRPHRVGEAADERHRGEADDLGSQQREERDLFVVPHQHGPARCAEDEGEINAGDANGDLAPVGACNLRAKDVKVEVNSGTSPKGQGGQRQQQNQAQNPLALLHAFSVRRSAIKVYPYVLTRP